LCLILSDIFFDVKVIFHFDGLVTAGDFHR